MGGCGNTVNSLTTCKSCLNYLHPGCAYKHKCTPINDSVIQLIKQLQNSVNEMAQQIKVLQDDNTGKILNEIKALREENSVIKQQIAGLSDRLEVLENVHNNSVPATEEIIREVADRNRRVKNFIVYGLKEDPANNPNEQETKDADTVKMLLTDIGITEFSIITKRIGKISANDDLSTSNRPRPIKVITSTENCISSVLKNAKKLKNINRWSGVYVGSDQTKMQQSLYKTVKRELEYRINNGEVNLKIKCKTGVPTIISQEN